jgi:hypothetical protein
MGKSEYLRPGQKTDSLQGDVTARTHTGTGTFFVPDFWKSIKTMFCRPNRCKNRSSPSTNNRIVSPIAIERRIGHKYRVSIGAQRRTAFCHRCGAITGPFTLLEVPLYFRWSSANHLLNATRGQTLVFKTIPTFNVSHGNPFYLFNNVTYMCYFPVVGGKPGKELCNPCPAAHGRFDH